MPVFAKAAAYFEQQEEGGSPREGFNFMGGKWGAEKEEKELPVDVPDDVGLAPSSPPIPTAAFSSSPPPVHEGVPVMNSNGFCGSRTPAQNGFFPPHRVLTGEKIYMNGGPGLAPKEYGVVGLSEKRMRNGKGLASSSSPPAVGHHSGQSSPMDGAGSPEDCPEEPSRKRVHISNDIVVNLPVLNRRNGVMVSENRSVMGVPTWTQLDKANTSGSKLRKGFPPIPPARTEGNGEAVGSAGVRLVDGEKAVNMLADAFRPAFGINGDFGSGHAEDEILGMATDDATDMEVDPNPITSANIDALYGSASPMAAEPVDDGTGSGREPEAEAAVRSAFADVFEEFEPRRGSGNSTDHTTHAASPDLNLPPPDEDETVRGSKNAPRDPPPHPQPQPQPQMRRSIEVIEFDDSDDEDEPVELRAVHESGGSSMKGKNPVEPRRRNGYRFSSSESTAPSYNADHDSDSDDCQVVGSWRPPHAQYRERAANPVVVEDDDDNYTESGQSSDSSEVEEVAGSQSEIRRRWEEAAMRRRMGRAMQSAGSQLNGRHGGTVNLDDDGTESQGLEESVATSTYRDSPDSKDQTETSEARDGIGGVGHRNDGPRSAASALHVHRTGGPQATVYRVDDERRPVRRPHIDLNGDTENVDVVIPDTPSDSDKPNLGSPPVADQDDIDTPNYVIFPGISNLDKVEAQRNGVHSESHTEEGASSEDANANGGDERWKGKHVVVEGFQNEQSDKKEVDVAGDGDGDDEAETSTAHHEDLLAAKERLKQTAQYRKTDEAEWASRQQEIQRQAAESKRLRQRKRQEADRKKEMERKQKERIEELRLSQRKEERNMDLRDQLRGQVRTELEQIAARCNDFATLLRQLGVPVEGGSHPSTQQVNAAYKKALFKFHPDRAVASSQGEPRYQVEAEEKFKLIQRLKDTLQPVANNYVYSSYRSFF